ncbi:MAG: protease [Sphaerisporangium sp.]|jgi:subtilisin family serine protease|nr:protease [Sphaerisporangium sp.]
MTPDRFMEQLGQISREMGVPLVAGPDETSPAYAYERDHIILPAGDLPDVFQVLNSGRRAPVSMPDERDVKAGLLRIKVTDEDFPDRDGGVARSLDAIRVITDRNGGRKVGGRNHVVAITSGGVNSCPSDEPVPTSRDWHPGLTPPSAALRRPVSIVVVDTGLLVNHDTLYPWMRRVVPTRGEPAKTGHEPALSRLSDAAADKEDYVKEYVGHGTFIAGIIAAIAPDADLRVSGKLVHAGALCERDFGHEILEAVEPSPFAGLGGETARWPDIISLSAGTSTECGGPLLGLAEFMRRLADHPETLLVAAAGNNGSADPFWPAASACLPEPCDAVLSVGALREDGVRGACFSNHGDWVRVYAPGERLVGAFLGTGQASRQYRYQHSTYDGCRWPLDPSPPFDYDCTCRFPAHVGELSTCGVTPSPVVSVDRFTGKAQWSGTSFSTPIVAAMIANHMMEHPGLDSRAAAAGLLAGPLTRTATVRGGEVRALWPPLWEPAGTSDRRRT